MLRCLSSASNALLALSGLTVRDFSLTGGACGNDPRLLHSDRAEACRACWWLLKERVFAPALTRILRCLSIRKRDLTSHVAGDSSVVLLAQPAGLGTTLFLHRLDIGDVLIVALLAFLSPHPFEEVTEQSVNEEASVGPVMMVLERLKYKKDDNFEVRHYPTLHTELVAVVLLPPAHHLDYEIRNQNFYGRLGIFAKLRQGLC